MKTAVRWIVVVAAVVAAVPGFAPAMGQTPESDQQAPPSKPNVLVIIADDQAHSIFNRQLMPTVFEEIVDRGVSFDRAYVNTSQCCPSRAQILTGLYGHHNGVDGNHVLLEHPTIAELMQDDGYRTILAGKYLNSWPCEPRAEWDRFVCLRGEGSKHMTLVDPRVHFQGNPRKVRGYQTEILADQISRFVDETPSDKPFFAVYSPTSPHMPANDDRYGSLQVPAHRPPNFDRAFEPGAAPKFATKPPMTLDAIEKSDMTYRKMARSTRALDDSIKGLLGSLGDRATNTLVIYISDNGYMYGEHRLHKKIAPYEESVRVPFAIRFPSAPTVPGAVSQALVQNVDIAPTIADAIDRDWAADGHSLLPLLAAPQSVVRDAALVENCRGENYPCWGSALKGSRQIPSFWGAITDQYKYVSYATGERELFDLTEDPYELTNLYGDPEHLLTQQAMAQRLELLIAPPVAETTLVTGPGSVDPTQVVRFRYFSQEKTTTYECRLTVNGVVQSWLPCGRFTQYMGPMAPGHYVFEVAAFDDTSRTFDATPASRSFDVASQ